MNDTKSRPGPAMKQIATLATSLVVLVAACATSGDSAGGSTRPTPPLGPETTVPSPTAATVPPVVAGAPLQVATPAGGQSGNRYVPGRADLIREPLRIPLDAAPAWVVGVAGEHEVVWVVADDTGAISAFAETDGEVSHHPIERPSLPAGSPPTVVASAGIVSVVEVPGASPSAGLAVTTDAIVATTPLGTVTVDGVPVDGVTALPDTRFAISELGRIALLADPTDQLTHGVLGDKIEAETVVVMDPSGSITATLPAPGGTVFEAVSPMWADVDGDGIEEILVTASDADAGARLVVYSAAGDLVAQSPPIGTGNRWLNQLAVAPVGPRGEIEVVEVRTPHIGGIVRWYELDGETLVLRASAQTYSTHRIGSRNLDQGLVLDADGDGRLDVVVPTQDQEAIVALMRTSSGAEPVSVQRLGARLATNIAAVARSDGTATLALGTTDGHLLIWP